MTSTLIIKKHAPLEPPPRSAVGVVRGTETAAGVSSTKTESTRTATRNRVSRTPVRKKGNLGRQYFCWDQAGPKDPDDDSDTVGTVCSWRVDRAKKNPGQPHGSPRRGSSLPRSADPITSGQRLQGTVDPRRPKSTEA